MTDRGQFYDDTTTWLTHGFAALACMERNMLGGWHRVNMIGVDAARITAEMMQVMIRGDRSARLLPYPAVCRQGFAFMPHGSVSELVLVALPFPASSLFIDQPTPIGLLKRMAMYISLRVTIDCTSAVHWCATSTRAEFWSRFRFQCLEEGTFRRMFRLTRPAALMQLLRPLLGKHAVIECVLGENLLASSAGSEAPSGVTFDVSPRGASNLTTITTGHTGEFGGITASAHAETGRIGAWACRLRGHSDRLLRRRFRGAVPADVTASRRLLRAPIIPDFRAVTGFSGVMVWTI